MSIITLLSDYGNKGSKVSKAKALLLSEIWELASTTKESLVVFVFGRLYRCMHF